MESFTQVSVPAPRVVQTETYVNACLQQLQSTAGRRETVALKVTIALCALFMLVYPLLRRFGIVRFITYPKHSRVPAMASDEVQRVVRASVGKRVRLVFSQVRHR
jgi:hypothetical protein